MGGAEVHSFITLAIYGVEWSTSCTGHFTPKKEPWFTLDWRVGGPQSYSGCYGEDKKSLPNTDSKPVSSMS
jgi:hypothetical protein